MSKIIIVPKEKTKEVMERWVAFVCKIKGHIWKYNFPIRSIPDKVICSRCKQKAVFNPKTLEWNNVDEFVFREDNRTDEQLIEQWHIS